MTLANSKYLAKLKELLRRESPDPDLVICVGTMWWLTLPETKAEILKQLGEPSPLWDYINKERKSHEHYTVLLPLRADPPSRSS